MSTLRKTMESRPLQVRFFDKGSSGRENRFEIQMGSTKQFPQLLARALAQNAHQTPRPKATPKLNALTK